MPFRSVSFPGVSRLLEPLTALPCCHRGLLLPQGRMVFRVCVCACVCRAVTEGFFLRAEWCSVCVCVSVHVFMQSPPVGTWFASTSQPL